MSTVARQTAPERREAVLEAAAQAFARGGLYGTSTEDIAAAAGISHPLILHHFASRAGLVPASGLDTTLLDMGSGK